MTKITLDAAQLQDLIASAVASALKAQPATKPNTLVDGKTERQLKLDVATVRAFAKRGIKNVKPRVDVMTYNRWKAAGYLVKEGEKSVKVKQFRLFHKSQVEFVGVQKPEPVTPAQIADYNARKAAMEAQASA